MNFIKKKLKSLLIKIRIINELFAFLWDHKLWWLMPAMLIIIIVMAILFFGQSTGAAPFIYALF